MTRSGLEGIQRMIQKIAIETATFKRLQRNVSSSYRIEGPRVHGDQHDGGFRNIVIDRMEPTTVHTEPTSTLRIRS